MQALDLSSLREVACKILQLNTQWSEAKKASYVKHAVREYHIHHKLHHPRQARQQLALSGCMQARPGGGKGGHAS